MSEHLKYQPLIAVMNFAYIVCSSQSHLPHTERFASKKKKFETIVNIWSERLAARVHSVSAYILSKYNAFMAAHKRKQ